MNHSVIDFDVDGDLVDPATGEPVGRDIGGFLRRHVIIAPDVTDIVVFVHGWRNNSRTALSRATKFMTLVENTYSDTRYPRLRHWNPHHLVVRWPSTSSPFTSGYRRIRDRAHLMSTSGRAPAVLAHLLGYLNAERRRPGGAEGTLRTRSGQYLHLVGHSFGCRFLAEAIQWAADARPDVLGWNRADPRYPWAADTVLLLQMALPHDDLASAFPRLIHNSPVNGPVVLTHSTADRALGLWHQLGEGERAVGYQGVTEPAGHITSTRLRSLHEDYTPADFSTPLVNVDANGHFRKGRVWSPAGAHADIFHPETAHLLLSLAQLAR